MPPEFVFSFEYDRAEFMRANRAIFRHAIRLDWLRRVWLVMLFVFGVFSLINMTADIRRGSYPALLPGFLMSVGWPLLPFLNGYVAIRRWERLNPVGNRTLTVRIDENRFASASYAGAGEIRWGAAMYVVETSEFLLVYVAYGAAYFLPLRLMSDAERTRVRALLESALDPKRLRLQARRAA